MKRTKENFIVITGGPGVGKTTLIEVLHQQGFQIVEEDARKIIRDQIATRKDGLPWKNKALYAALMLEASMKSYDDMMCSENTGFTFFDRGVLDSICYMGMENIPITEETKALMKQYAYNSKVFILPPWKEIYEIDSERKQIWSEAEATFNNMQETYLAFGYDIVEVPKITPEERMQYILQQVGNNGRSVRIG
ncbi:AAA family ATPase [Sphingobacterium deserti]|uniref:p-loop containing nucleoside triphosphate hydrolase n=1 Tax=Sphingobacterium deserti TaxID=1229276 RepID=A0A0B8T691_9SPHI|nr:AAA family ATPase [Sphingobacterium deserti]KGE13449.1 p-loop containing nucleoside triphosphate hydrolase [Sphingobacterium deserti]